MGFGMIYTDRIENDGVLVPTGIEKFSADGNVSALANSILLDTTAGSVWVYMPDISECTWPIPVAHVAGGQNAEIHPNQAGQGIGEVDAVLTVTPGQTLWLAPDQASQVWRIVSAP